MSMAELSHQHVHLFIKIQLNQEAARWSVTNGSVGNSVAGNVPVDLSLLPLIIGSP